MVRLNLSKCMCNAHQRLGWSTGSCDVKWKVDGFVHATKEYDVSNKTVCTHVNWWSLILEIFKMTEIVLSAISDFHKLYGSFNKVLPLPSHTLSSVYSEWKLVCVAVLYTMGHELSSIVTWRCLAGVRKWMHFWANEQ